MPFLGEISALITAALWSVSSLAFASASRRLGSTQVNIARLILATGYLWLVVILFGLEFHLSRTQVLNLAVSGVIGLALGDSFLFKAYQYNGARLTMVVMSIAPAIAAIGAYVMLGEDLSATGILGILLTLCGVALVILEQRGGSMTRRSRGVISFMADSPPLRVLDANQLSQIRLAISSGSPHPPGPAGSPGSCREAPYRRRPGRNRTAHPRGTCGWPQRARLPACRWRG